MKNMDYSTAYVGHWGLGVGRKGAFLPPRQGFDRWYGVPALHNSYCLVKFNQTEQALRASHEYPNEERSVEYLLIVFMFTMMIGLLVALWMFKKIDTMTLVLLASPEVLVLYMSYFSVHLMDFIHSRNCVLYRENKIIEQPYIVNNMTLRFTKETVQLMKVFSKRKHPFFIMQSYLNMHKPWYLSHPFSNCSKDVFSCSLQELDWSIGKILKTIEDLNLENDTMVIFTSTGGSCLEGHVFDCQRGYGHMASDDGQVKPLKGGGLTNIWEGDIRVPTIIQWKNAIQPGRTINFTTSCMDILPTLVELTNQVTINNFDGKSLLKILFNTSIGPQHGLLFHYTDIFRPAAVSYGRYKLVLITQSEDESTTYHDPPILFDIESDPSETTPIPIDHFPDDLLSTVTALIDEHLTNRSDKGVSEFDNPFLPFYFPCVNAPVCYQRKMEEDDFRELFNNTI